MISFPNCKINLGLRIIRKREDGFHDIETVFYPLPIKDILEVLPVNNEVRFNSTGLPIPGNSSDNLCLRVFQLLKNDFPQITGINIHLHKIIPMGAGLGGGSSDASYVLQMMNDLFELEIDNSTLENYGLQLGSDCPFFLRDKCCFASGRGEILEPIDVDLSQWKILVVHPGIHINTGWAFSQVIPVQHNNQLLSLVQRPVETWKGELGNDFEKICMAAYPVLADLKNLLYKKGAVYASMSGSGSSFYALFSKEAELKLQEFPFSYSLVS